jgi:hypothetical protein
MPTVLSCEHGAKCGDNTYMLRVGPRLLEPRFFSSDPESVDNALNSNDKIDTVVSRFSPTRGAQRCWDGLSEPLWVVVDSFKQRPFRSTAIALGHVGLLIHVPIVTMALGIVGVAGTAIKFKDGARLAFNAWLTGNPRHAEDALHKLGQGVAALALRRLGIPALGSLQFPALLEPILDGPTRDAAPTTTAAPTPPPPGPRMLLADLRLGKTPVLPSTPRSDPNAG